MFCRGHDGRKEPAQRKRDRQRQPVSPYFPTVTLHLAEVSSLPSFTFLSLPFLFTCIMLKRFLTPPTMNVRQPLTLTGH